MDFGMFVEQMRRGTSQADSFREMFEFVDAAEAWGLDVVWLAEMLVNPDRSVLSAPLLVASWIVARTRRLRVGTAVQLLPLNHPAARRGRGHHARSSEPGPVRLRHRPQRRASRLRRARRPLRGEPGALLRGAGDHPEGLEGRALQPRGPVLSVLQRHGHAAAVQHARTRRSGWPRRPRRRFPALAKLGLPIFVGLRGMDIPELARCLKTYRAAWREAGHAGDGDVCLRIPDLRRAHGEGRPRRAVRDHHVLHPATGRSDPGAGGARRDGASRAPTGPGAATDQPLVRGHPATGRWRSAPVRA